VSAPLLDTHAWFWWVKQDPALGAATITALDRLATTTRPVVSVISLWEIAMLVERRRLALDVPLREWLDAAAHPRKVELVQITPAIAAATADLPSDFQRDPADRILVATSRVLGVPMLTYDRRITDSKLVARWRVRV
jgi:PIN domain nuclease of toxin-antitoxin system